MNLESAIVQLNRFLTKRIQDAIYYPLHQVGLTTWSLISI